MKIKEYFSNLPPWHLNYYRVIHGIKTAIACLVGVAIEKHYNWPSGQWVPITIMVVMSAQAHFGGALRKAYMRFLGTVSGVLVTITVLWLFGSNIAVILCTIFIACIIFTYIANISGDISYAGTLGGVTVILALAGQQANAEIAIQRGFYIIVGICIALLASRFIFPVHARYRLRYHVATTLRNLQKLYLKTIQMSTQPEQKAAATELVDLVATDLLDQPRLINEAAAESRDFSNKKVFFSEIISSERRLRRLINLMYRGLYEIESPEITKKHLLAVEGLHIVIKNSLNHLADCFEKNILLPKATVDLNGAIVKITQVVEKLPKNEEACKKIAEHSILFFMEQILKELKNMEQLITEVNSKNKNNVV